MYMKTWLQRRLEEFKTSSLFNFLTRKVQQKIYLKFLGRSFQASLRWRRAPPKIHEYIYINE